MGRLLGARRCLFPSLTGLFLNGWLLSRAATFTPAVVLSAGANTLSVKPLGSTTVYTLSGVVSGAGQLAVNANVMLTASATYTGATTINAGFNLTLNYNASSSGFTVPAGARLTIAPLGATMGSGAASGVFGAGTVVKTGSNIWSPANGFGFTYGMSGGLLDIQAGTWVASTSYLANFTNNKSSLNILSGAVAAGYEANVTVDALTGAGAFQLGYTNTGGATIGVNNTAAGAYNSAGTATFTGSISPLPGVTTGSSLTKVGTGTQILLGANSYKGTTAINAGMLQFGNATTPATLGSGAITIAAGATLALWQYNTAQTGLTVTSTITGAGTLTLNGPGSDNGSFAALSGAGGFSGPLVLNGARLSLNASFGNGANSVTVNSGSNIYLYGGTFANPLTLSGSGGDPWGAIRLDTGNLSGAIALAGDTTLGQQAASSVTISGAITGAFTLTLTPATGGTFNLTGNSSAVTTINATAGDIAITGTSTALTVAAGAAVGGGAAITGSVKALTFSAAGSILRVRPLSTTSVSLITATSLVNASGFTVAYASGFTVAAGVYNLLKITSTAAPTLGAITSSGLSNIGRTGATYAVTGSAGAWNLAVTLT
ncbi:hypothetical protein B9Z51_08695 [Limnohabitans sp. T6-5]|uniref:beta strand repeat-containing protein n=1 Tax=Limnohabitans sp. T6-5 TaxID=1100724 RepID=UPI000D3409F2|nr:autotransporter-associated beta strand repeat-containing protein [Limnohabitans sp. T6-5]PUE09001.1 hypothetical protein B9Z51_08695 [Limnohabitans sp. T6-5]